MMERDPHKMLCISMYVPDIKRMDETVEHLKRLGMPGANRSALIRYALTLVKPNEVPEKVMRRNLGHGFST